MQDLRHVDVRTVERYLAKGRITQEDYQKFLASLPDLADEAEEVDYEGLLQKDEPQQVFPTANPNIAGTPILTRGSAAGPLPPLPTR